MDISMGATLGGRRRKHSDEFRAEVLAECRQPSRSISGVALKHGVNANLVRTWLRKSESPLASLPIIEPTSASSNRREPQEQQFVPVRVDVTAAPTECSVGRSSAIQLELRRGHSTVSVTWPSELASDCGVWLREWLR